ncbi:hypothetical protein sos41_35420 [Alphaproteobacteria bacterium SO-S41]|nr:hypothetical protein sos41_35420 [Alphaproteobacteria bacterium SO-S41]
MAMRKISKAPSRTNPPLRAKPNLSKAELEARLEDALKETFPCSDPISIVCD